MQPSDTAYPRFKTRLTQAELEQFYTPTEEELAYCTNVTLSPGAGDAARLCCFAKDIPETGIFRAV